MDKNTFLGLSLELLDIYDVDILEENLGTWNDKEALIARFYFKQRLHMQAVLKLGEHYDLRLIVRCMIEGIVISQKLMQDSSFVKKWQYVSAIDDLRIFEVKKNAGLQISQEQKDQVFKSIASVPECFYKKKSKDKFRTKQGIKHADFTNYKDTVSGLIDQMSDERMWQDLYGVYNECSKWQHWSPSGVCQYVRMGHGQVQIMDNSLSVVLMKTALLCLIISSCFMDNTFKMNKKERLDEVMELLQASGSSNEWG